MAADDSTPADFLFDTGPATKRCLICREPKPLTEFYLYRRSDEGGKIRRHSYCKQCANNENAKWKKKNPEKRLAIMRRGNLKHNYALTPAQFAEMHSKQNGVCAICNKPEGRKTRAGLVKLLSVDHDHQTGNIRGLLCQKCNSIIGLCSEDADILRNAIAYLGRYRGQ